LENKNTKFVGTQVLNSSRTLLSLFLFAARRRFAHHTKPHFGIKNKKKQAIHMKAEGNIRMLWN